MKKEEGSSGERRKAGIEPSLSSHMTSPDKITEGARQYKTNGKPA